MRPTAVSTPSFPVPAAVGQSGAPAVVLADALAGAPWGIDEIHAAVLGGALTLVALMQRCLQQADAGAASAWISRVERAQLLETARSQDALLRSEGAAALERYPLLGIPFAVKDNIDVAGLPTTAACPGYARAPAAEDAFVVAVLRAAGAIPLGKTNLDQFATGLVGTRSPYGVVPNPIDPDYLSGGSSSGSAYAVATGAAIFALGSDTAGSGRVPAAFCGVIGLKPTRGWLSNRGMLPACRTLDCVSVFALTVADAWQVATLAARYDVQDPYARLPQAQQDRPSPLRLALPLQCDFSDDALAQLAYENTIRALDAAGYALTRIDIGPLLEVAQLLYDGPWLAERYVAMRSVLERDDVTLDPTVSSIVRAAQTQTAAQCFEAQYRLAELRRCADMLLAPYDALLLPTAPAHYRISAVARAPVATNSRLGTYTNFVNLLDQAALALPGLRRTDGLPSGITLIGPAWSDSRLAQIGAQIETVIDPEIGAFKLRPARAVPQPLLVAPTVKLAVVGAPLAGQPLHTQLRERRARLLAQTTTAAHYRLYSLTGKKPTKPGLVWVGPEHGAAIEVEVYELPEQLFGSFVALVPPPLAIGSVELASGEIVNGFVCEPRALQGAMDVTEHRGWRNFLASVAAG